MLWFSLPCSQGVPRSDPKRAVPGLSVVQSTTRILSFPKKDTYVCSSPPDVAQSPESAHDLVEELKYSGVRVHPLSEDPQLQVTKLKLPAHVQGPNHVLQDVFVDHKRNKGCVRDVWFGPGTGRGRR